MKKRHWIIITSLLVALIALLGVFVYLTIRTKKKFSDIHYTTLSAPLGLFILKITVAFYKNYQY
ncbi:hypothetical protein [Lactococcus cremoris]|uniref:hypothetical protein n=1 Tax=Lactococcus lactis subsp. cremoris TaxID=1359 RepID=UPI0007AECCB0|nr:hypothetical protein [Lactococcus cremoris]